MKKLIPALVLLFCISNGFAQTDSTKKQTITTAKSDTSKKASNADGAFLKVEVESEFPGGLAGWGEFLQQNLTYPRKAVRKDIQGTVVLQFIVCTDGTVCDIEAVSGPEELREAAVAALKKTPKWIPAIQDGRNVKSYKKQPIVYLLDRGK